MQILGLRGLPTLPQRGTVRPSDGNSAGEGSPRSSDISRQPRSDNESGGQARTRCNPHKREERESSGVPDDARIPERQLP